MAQARGNSISDASEKTGCLLMGCSREEGLHLSSFQECKTDIAVWLGFGKMCRFAGSCFVVVLLSCNDVARVVSGSFKAGVRLASMAITSRQISFRNMLI